MFIIYLERSLRYELSRTKDSDVEFNTKFEKMGQKSPNAILASLLWPLPVLHNQSVCT